MMAETKELFEKRKKEKIIELQKEAMNLMLEAKTANFPRYVAMFASAAAKMAEVKNVAMQEFDGDT